MFKLILFLALMQSVNVQADIKHQIRFCAGKFCGVTSPLTITQQLELNQQFVEGNLIDSPTRYEKEIIQSAKLKDGKKSFAVASGVKK